MGIIDLPQHRGGGGQIRTDFMLEELRCLWELYFSGKGL